MRRVMTLCAIFAVFAAFLFFGKEASAELFWTQDKRPSVHVSASSSNVVRGEQFTISWSADNADKCKEPGDWVWHDKKSGSFTDKLYVSSGTYKVTCKNSAGESSDSVKVSLSRGEMQVSVAGHSSGTVEFVAPAKFDWSFKAKGGGIFGFSSCLVYGPNIHSYGTSINGHSELYVAGEYYYGMTCGFNVGSEKLSGGVNIVVREPEAAPQEGQVIENPIGPIWSGGGGGGSSSNYCSTIDRGSGDCAKACNTSVKKCDACKADHGCGGKKSEPKANITVELKGPDPSQKRESDGMRRVKEGKEVEYKVSVDHTDDDEKIEYRFQCNENKTGKYQKVNSKKTSQKFRCTYEIKEGTEKYQDPIIRVEQKDRGKAKDTKTILVYIPEGEPGSGTEGGGDTDPPVPSAAPETDIKGE